MNNRRRDLFETREAFVAAALALAVGGCAAIVGVDFDSARIATAVDPTEPIATPGDGAVPISQDVHPPDAGCPIGEKSCGGTCVSKGAPEYGCASAGCAPCSLFRAAKSACGADGRCFAETCISGFADCNGDPSDGCETDLTRPETCGVCGKACPPGTVCADGDCLTSCPAPLAECDGACVDKMSSPMHCGGCGKSCAGGANADPACVAGKCELACRSGFGDCTSSPAKNCDPLPKWYVDADGDEYGSSAFAAACAKPAGHVAVSGDCLDSNARVHPGASGAGTPFAGPVGPSFDYDCDGVEVEVGVPLHWSGCGPSCDQFGFLPVDPPRAGAGVNNYCGSTSERYCMYVAGCAESPMTMPSGVQCK